MNEVKTSDIKEHKELPYQEIKPKTDLTVDKAKKYWDNKLDSDKTKTENAGEVTHKDESPEAMDGNPRVVYEDGHNKYYDDNGNLYRIDKELLPDSEYTINGYDYKTDEQGRIVEASGQLRLKEHKGYKQIKDSLHDIGKGDENKKTDEKGHLIGDQFGGKNGLENAVAQDADINKNDYKNLEYKLADHVRAGDDVRVQIEPIYEGDSHRPDAISVTYTINGETSVQIFPNGKG